MDRHRRVDPDTVLPLPTQPPFSCFDWAEINLAPTESIRRCFSLARSLGMQALVAEDIPADGLVLEENQELQSAISDYTMPALKRLSFWKKKITCRAMLADLDADSLCGYAILKHDRAPSRQRDHWHVFEAVFRKYPHEHNCVPQHKHYLVRVRSKEFSIPGVLYAQQNGLNKVCAHVALRTLLARLLPAGDVSYAAMNRLAAKAARVSFDPANGLGVIHIRAILQHYKLGFRDIDYVTEEKRNKRIRHTHPFQKYVYAGIESGRGALLGFHMTGPRASNDRHIIPFFGHTFNKDTWVPDADSAYFNVGGGIGYIPSESWTSSFLGHDDNFGPNFCIPRLYIAPEQADYAVEFLHEGVGYSGVHAEAVALQFLYSLLPHLVTSSNAWIKRLAAAAHPTQQRVVLRAVCVPRTTYLQHLQCERDWNGNQENPLLIDILQHRLPKTVWVVEISLPHLFPANERKLGEMVLNPFVQFDQQTPVNYKLFLLARLPARLFVMDSSKGGEPQFLDVASGLVSHMPLLRV